MPNYAHLRTLCKTDSDLSISLIDNFLLYYASQHDKLDKEFENRMSRFRHVKQEIPSSFINMSKSQYIIHRVFKQGGLINKYLDHAAIKNLETEQKNYLSHIAANPWRFSFSEITSSPAPDFYEMEDVFTGDSFLLFSPSISKTLEEHPVSLWFNLIGFNGACWQTFGPVNFYKCFDEDDIFFFATELNSLIASEDDLLDDIENNPVPYMMLVTGSDFPGLRQGEFETVHVIGEAEVVIPGMQELEKDFLVEYVPGVYKLSHEVWSGPPHYAEAFYDEERGVVILYSLTDYGYVKMSSLLNKYKLNLPLVPDIRIHLPMVVTIKKLQKKGLELNPYGKHFEIKSPPENEELIDKLNLAFGMALPYINAGEEPDIDAIAKEVGIDPGILRSVIEQSRESVRKLRK